MVLLVLTDLHLKVTLWLFDPFGSIADIRGFDYDRVVLHRLAVASTGSEQVANNT